jgi:M6 family metalloprotease-like protein
MLKRLPIKLACQLLIIMVILLAFSSAVFAAYLKDVPISVMQPDGDVLNCLASGDEFFNYLHDENGNIIIQHPSSGYYTYAQLDGQGKIMASSRVAMNNGNYCELNDVPPYPIPLKNAGIKAGDIDFALNADLHRGILQPKAAPSREIPLAAEPSAAKTVQGSMENIIIMICFADENPIISPEIMNKTAAVFNGSSLSLDHYLQTISEGKLKLHSTLVGLDGGEGDTVFMYQDSYPRNYYRVYNEVTNPVGYKEHEYGERKDRLLSNAVKACANSPLLAGINLDVDNDGYIDSTTFIVSGGVEGWSELLWPHMSILNDGSAAIYGKPVHNYTFHLVDRLFPPSGSIGFSVICHEALHTFGFPDLYRYVSTGNPVGSWDVMAFHTANPQFPNSHSRLRYAGWGGELTEITADGRYSLSPIGNKDGITAYAIATSSPGEFILLEYRSDVNVSGYDTFFASDSSYYHKGLTIARINTAIYGNSGSYDEVYYYRSGETALNQGWGDISIASLSANANRLSFGNDTAHSGYSGTIYLYSGVNTKNIISNVSIAGETISFDVKINDAADSRPSFLAGFPDARFRSEVLRLLNMDGKNRTANDIMSFADAVTLASFSFLNVEGLGISDMTGLKYFSGLNTLNCGKNQLATLDVSNNTYLWYLICSGNQLVALDMSDNIDIYYINCAGNKLAALDVLNNTNLSYLDCSDNMLATLDISKNTMLKELYCDTNQLSRLDVSNNTALWRLDCRRNYMLSTNDVNGWQKLGMELNTTFLFNPQRSTDPSSDVTDSFKDINFLAAVRALINKPNGPIYNYDLVEITNLNIFSRNITDLSGIEHFTKLIILDCSSNRLTTLDLSKNTALVSLNCHSNRLTALNISNNTALAYLQCQSNELAALDISGNTMLGTLYCYSNQLATLNISGNTMLETLYCDNNQLATLDISNNTMLETLHCYRNQLVTLDTSNSTRLKTLWCNNNQLTTLDFSNSTAFGTLDCSNNQLTKLDISKNTVLFDLSCYNNQLTKLDISKNTGLIILRCFNNQLTLLDVSNNINLRTIDCRQNYMKSTDDVIGWQVLGISWRPPSYFNPQKPVITYSGAILYQPSPTSANIALYIKDSEDAPVATAYTAGDSGAYTLGIPPAPADTRYKLVVTKPGYLSYTINNLTLTQGEPIETVDIRQLAGDVNGDGIVNAVDLTCLLSEFNREPQYFRDADIDGNGIVNAADLTYLLAGFNKRDVVEIRN